MQRFLTLICLLLISLLTMLTTVQAQQTALTAVPKKSEAPPKATLKIPVWVEQEDSIFWRDGKRPDFKVFLEDKEVQIKSFQNPQSGTILLVVFDTVSDLARVDEARNALQDKLKELPEQYWVGLLKAQDELSVLQEPTADRNLLREKIQAIQVNGKAGLLDTLEPVAQLATAILQKAAVRVSVLYITDGGISNYRADYSNPVINSSDSGDLSRRFSDRAIQERLSRLAESLAEFTVPIFVLHVAQRSDVLNLAYQSGLEKIAADTGGAALFCRTNDEIRPSLQTLFAQLSSSYVIAVETPIAKHKTIKVRVEAQGAEGKNFARVRHVNQLQVRKR